MEQSRFKKWWIILLFATIIVYIIGLFVPVMDVDAAQYAAISRMMYLNHDYVQLHCLNHNYLDKPPMLFWLSVISFHIFGIHTWSYKLPSLLFTLLSIYATFRLAEKLYGKPTAYYASLMLATCQAFFLFNTDVRTDTVLTASIIVSTWQLYEFIETKRWFNALVGFTFMASGMLAKGPLGLCVPALALASQLAYQRRWKVFLWPAWWVGLVYILILLIPMIYGLYEQYGWKGPRFFFWDQSFGRIIGTNEWHNNAGYFFFVHTFLWAFLPWTLLPVISLWDRIILLVKTKLQYNSSVELITYGGFVLTFLALSFSHYKLPHYIFNVFPFAAIFSAASFDNLISKYKWLAVTQKVTLILIFIILFFLMGYLVQVSSISLWVITSVLFFTSAYFLLKKSLPPFLVIGSTLCALSINFFMNAHFYPTILTYQSGSNMGWYISKHNIPPQQVSNYNYLSYSEDFYAGAWIGWTSYLNPDSLHQWNAQHQTHYIGGRREMLNELKSNNVNYELLYKTPDYPVTLLTYKFLSPATRSSAIDTMYLVHIK